MTLPEAIQSAARPVFNALPIDSAMQNLVVSEGAPDSLISVVEQAVADPALADRPALQSGLWLYVDELDRSHTISQGIHDATGSFWHGIMHRREGDFGNSHYWFNKVGHHPAMDEIAGYDAHGFIDDVQARHAQAPADLIELQRAEWTTLFAWCARD